MTTIPHSTYSQLFNFVWVSVDVFRRWSLTLSRGSPLPIALLGFPKKKKNFGLNFDKQQKRLPIFDVTFYFLFCILNLLKFMTFLHTFFLLQLSSNFIDKFLISPFLLIITPYSRLSCPLPLLAFPHGSWILKFKPARSASFRSIFSFCVVTIVVSAAAWSADPARGRGRHTLHQPTS
jgi:hypothetical protein